MGAEISAIADMVAYWDVLQEYVAGFVGVSTKVLDRVMADELSAVPGMDEIVASCINKQATGC